MDPTFMWERLVWNFFFFYVKISVSKVISSVKHWQCCQPSLKVYPINGKYRVPTWIIYNQSIPSTSPTPNNLIFSFPFLKMTIAMNGIHYYLNNKSTQYCTMTTKSNLNLSLRRNKNVYKEYWRTIKEV